MKTKMPTSIAKTAMEKAVVRGLNQVAEKGYPVLSVLQDLGHGGCSSGMIPSMIYYKDTLAFFKKHKKEISSLLQEFISDTGQGPAELFRGWDKDDPLAMDTQNQNLLAWFAFEETARRLAYKIGIEM